MCKPSTCSDVRGDNVHNLLWLAAEEPQHGQDMLGTIQNAMLDLDFIEHVEVDIGDKCNN